MKSDERLGKFMTMTAAQKAAFISESRADKDADADKFVQHLQLGHTKEFWEFMSALGKIRPKTNGENLSRYQNIDVEHNSWAHGLEAVKDNL